MQRVVPGVVVVLFCAAGAKAEAHLHSAPAPLSVQHVGEPVKDEYLVFLVEGDRAQIPALAESIAQSYEGQIIQVWNDGVQGFWISMDEFQAEAMLHDPHVRSIEENGFVHESGTQSVGGSDPFWHLDRIDQRSATLDNMFQYCSGATQVYAYVIDRGVRGADPQLNGRVLEGVNTAPADDICSGNTDPTQPAPYPDGASFMVNGRNPCGEHNTTNAGHGTAVATVLAGSGVGVSKATVVIPLRVYNCQNDASIGTIVGALNWLVGNSNTLWDPVNQRSRVPAVANFSIAAAAFSELSPETEWERKVRTFIHGGVVVVASANNQNTNRKSLSQIPARLSYSNPNLIDSQGHPLFGGPERLIAVGGTMQINAADQRWVCDPNDPFCDTTYDPGSNYGPGVDIWAPAQNIQSGHLAAITPSTGDTWTGAQYRRPLFRQPPRPSLIDIVPAFHGSS